jgi:hypothetical protein
MRVFLMALAIGALTTTAHAQGLGGVGNGSSGGRHHQQQKNADTTPPKPKADDKAYNAALKQLPNKPYDPWHGLH